MSRLLRDARLQGVLAALLAVATGCLVAYLAVLLLLGRLPESDERGLVVPALLGTAVAILVAAAVHRALQRVLVPTRRRSPEATLRMLGDRASRGVPVEELLLQLGESLRVDFEAASVELWTGDGDRLDRLLCVPAESVPVTHLDADAVRLLGRVGVAGEGWLRLWLPDVLTGREDRTVRLVPAVHAGTVLGLVVVTHDGVRTFDDEDERTLLDVGRRLGLLLHNQELDSALQATLDDLRRTNDDLRASRARLAAASDDVRRRIERDLHDGAQQHLVAIAVNLSLASELIEDDPQAARELVAQTRQDAGAAISELRDLAHGIYPSLLIEAGLVPALKSLASRHPVGLTVEASGIGRCAPQVEAAVYFCCLEALQNASKHAPGSDVRMTLTRDGAALHVEVVDDGPGLPAGGAVTGHGLQNMTDRLGAVGGRVAWGDAPGGGMRVRLDVVAADVVTADGAA
jgi:signal transduction histidine kinase